VRLNSPEAIVLIAGVGSAFVLGLIGAIWLRHKCKRVPAVAVPADAPGIGDIDGTRTANERRRERSKGGRSDGAPRTVSSFPLIGDDQAPERPV
jgi:hypothetical protein